MSSLNPRTRRTRAELRDETRERLMAAAEELFAQRGLGAVSLDQIATTAGYTKGAFYSNFKNRDELVFALIERHRTQSITDANALAVDARSPEEFLAALLERETRQSPQRLQLGIEYTLYASRDVRGRARLKELNALLLAQMADMITTHFGADLPIDVLDAAKIVLALDQGFALLHLTDPSTYPADSWGNAMVFLADATAALTRDTLVQNPE